MISFFVNLIVLPLVFDLHPTFEQNFAATMIFTVISVVRQYFVRRWFNWMHMKGIL